MLELSRVAIQRLCQKINLLPHRSAGQNFLTNKKIIGDIIDFSSLQPEDVVLEIGPGFGFLTEAIREKVKKIIAVELDKRMAAYLTDVFASHKNIIILNQDIFKLNLGDYFTDLNYKLIANLPYNISSLVLRNFLSLKPRPREMTLMLQKEVAKRILAKPGEMSILAVVCQFYSKPRLITPVERQNFWPTPAVDSALIKLENIGLTPIIDEKAFIKLIKVGFSSKRKKLTNNLRHGLGILPKNSEKTLEKLGLSPLVRPQELSVDNWLKLTKYFFDILI